MDESGFVKGHAAQWNLGGFRLMRLGVSAGHQHTAKEALVAYKGP